MNQEGALFGVERLYESVAAWRGLAAQTICDRMIENVNAYRGSAAQSDDIAVVALRVR
jgi:serine phosphatase RsbU (regulator of sigma subunit)